MTDSPDDRADDSDEATDGARETTDRADEAADGVRETTDGADARDARFLVDAMCGSLARHLRMCGYDAAYALDRSVAGGPDAGSDPGSDADPDRSPSDDALLSIARREDRILVTRDRELAARADDAIELESGDVTDRLRRLSAAGIDLSLPEEPTRCSRCNGTLERVPATGSTPDYAPDPGEEAVWRCPVCDQRYWRGSHWDDVAATLSDL